MPESTKNAYNHIIWNTLSFSHRRFNLCENCKVDKDYFKSLTYIGTFEFTNIIKVLFPEDKVSSILWHLRKTKVEPLNSIHLYKSVIHHHIRSNDKLGHHYENWIICLLPCKDEFFRLCPLCRDSDFNFDIYEYLNNYDQKLDHEYQNSASSVNLNKSSFVSVPPTLAREYSPTRASKKLLFKFIPILSIKSKGFCTPKIFS